MISPATSSKYVAEMCGTLEPAQNKPSRVDGAWAPILPAAHSSIRITPSARPFCKPAFLGR